MTTLTIRPSATTAAHRPAPPLMAPPSGPGQRRWRLGGLADVTLPLGLAVLAAVTHAHYLGAQSFSDDEGTYVAQAWAVVHEHALSHYTYWYDHPPLGWLVVALWQIVTGATASTAVGSARGLMVVLAAVDAVLMYMAARRLSLHQGVASVAVVAWVLSPLALDYSRMVFLDGVALPMLLGAFVLVLSPRRHLWAYAAAGVLLAAAVLTKPGSTVDPGLSRVP